MESKKIVQEYLKNAGVKEEEIEQIGQVMDKELASLMKTEAAAEQRAQQEAASAARREIAKLAEQNNIRSRHN